MSERGSFGEPLISRERFEALGIQQACPHCRMLGGHAPTCVTRLVRRNAPDDHNGGL